MVVEKLSTDDVHRVAELIWEEREGEPLSATNHFDVIKSAMERLGFSDDQFVAQRLEVLKALKDFRTSRRVS